MRQQQPDVEENLTNLGRSVVDDAAGLVVDDEGIAAVDDALQDGEYGEAAVEALKATTTPWLVLLTRGGGMPAREARQHIARWDKGTLQSRAASILHHAREHGYGDDVVLYLRKAQNFNRRGARSSGLRPDGTILYQRADGEFLIERAGKIVSYGYN